ncbi:hypothetical protein ACQKWADRAFT_106005 [Trichoderma austrokoningii]
MEAEKVIPFSLYLVLIAPSSFPRLPLFSLFLFPFFLLLFFFSCFCTCIAYLVGGLSVLRDAFVAYRREAFIANFCPFYSPFLLYSV